MQLDDNLKQVLRELGRAINEAVSDSDRIQKAIAGVRSAGYDIVLKLDATIGLAPRESKPVRMTVQDRRFLDSLRIRVDDEILEDETDEERVAMTPQDIKFLRSLKISVDNMDD
ncbi:MAG TPA: hypothetical protein VJX29_12460 [Candidatus Acidoferrales bacterium]|nr:hypothetical protein [Candidatus Acidoferrales bacterium]